MDAAVDGLPRRQDRLVRLIGEHRLLVDDRVAARGEDREIWKKEDVRDDQEENPPRQHQ